VTTAIAPMLRWNCHHVWQQIGVPRTYWTSNGSQDPPPLGAPSMIPVRCLICGGETEVPASPAKEGK
jgi:hypothetical protein